METDPNAKTPVLLDESFEVTNVGVGLTVEVEDVLQSGSWDVAGLSLEYKGAPVLIVIIID